MATQAALPNMNLGGQTVPGGSQNINPLGSSVFSTLASSSPVVGTLPGQGSSPGVSVGSLPGLPTGIMGGGQTTPASTGGYNPAAGVTDVNQATHGAGSKTLLGDLQATYGQGTGTALGNVLGTLGTSTSMAENLMLQPTMQAEQQGLASAGAALARAGYDPGSSASAITTGDVIGQTNAAVAGQMGNIGLSEEQMLLGSLTGLGQAHGPDVGGWQTFGNIMQGVGQGALGLGEAALLGPGAPALTGGLSSMLGGLFGHGGGGALPAGATSTLGQGAYAMG